jgi:hypothetical protein
MADTISIYDGSSICVLTSREHWHMMSRALGSSCLDGCNKSWRIPIGKIVGAVHTSHHFWDDVVCFGVG